MEPWALPDIRLTSEFASKMFSLHQNISDMNSLLAYIIAFGSKDMGTREWYFFAFRSRRSLRMPTRCSARSYAVANEVSGDKIFISARATWHVASAACHHMTGNKNLLTDIVPVSDRHVPMFIWETVQKWKCMAVDQSKRRI